MAAKATAKAETIYQLKITLRRSKPPIWRRIQVTDSTTLRDLHEIVQVVMGWTNSHLHQFVVTGRPYSDPRFELDDVSDERRVSLSRLALQPRMHFGYEYDFGDSWEHDILVEKTFPPEPGAAYPRCITGKLACPPEDCGGTWGYYQLLETVQDPRHPDYKEMREWLGDGFDPDAFDLASVNARLSVFR